MAQASGKKIKRSKATEDFASEVPTGSAGDMAETVPFDSQPPWADSQDQPLEVGAGVEMKQGEDGNGQEEGAEEEKLTDDELVEPVICHEQCDYPDTPPDTPLDPPAPARDDDAGKDKVEAYDVKGSQGAAAAAAAKGIMSEVPMNPPASPRNHDVDLVSDEDSSKNQNKDPSEKAKTTGTTAKGTWKDRP